MTKPELLDYLARVRDADAHEVAEVFGLPYPTAA